MNRAEKTKEYLIKQLDLFKGYKDLVDSKDSFFEAIRRFRGATILYLRKTKIIKQSKLQKLDNLLANIDTMKSKGTNTEVYWKRVRLEYGNVQSILNDLILSMDQTKVPFRIECTDFFKEVFTKHYAIIVILSVVSFLIGLLINHIISFLK